MSLIRSPAGPLTTAWHTLAHWWATLTPTEAFALRVFLVALWLALGGLAAYSLIRRGLGHRKFRGRWYTARQWRHYLQQLERQERAGIPLPFEEAQLLEALRARQGSRRAGPSPGE